MRIVMLAKLVVAATLVGALCIGHWAFGNGGPFVVKHPNGDPAAKGVLARLEPTLKPAEETRLRVLDEDLTIRFGTEGVIGDKRIMPPLVDVTAAYRIENPTDREVLMDFGFPILRGIYLEFLMVPSPDVRITVDKKENWVNHTMISNSVIYGMIRRGARRAIEKGIAADPELARLTAAVRSAWIVSEPPPAKVQPPAAQQSSAQRPAAQPPAARQPTKSAKQKGKSTDATEYSSDLDIPFTQNNFTAAVPGFGGGLTKAKPRPERKPSARYLPARDDLRTYLTTKRGWNDRDAALLVEYASLEFTPVESKWWVNSPRDRWDICSDWEQKDLDALKAENLGALAAIGEQKATQLFAQLASLFDKTTAGTYEAIFTAWGGDVRERAIDLATGKIRPRELTLPAPKANADDSRKGPPPENYDQRLTADPIVYARVDYLDPRAKISREEKESCQAILKNLPVVFTFAPMNLLYYQVKFAPHSTHTVTVRYQQYAYADTRDSGSYQLAYVLHPATLWKEFGPIHVTLQVPDGIVCLASVPMERVGRGKSRSSSGADCGPQVYKATLEKPEQKRGELFIGIDKPAWDKMFSPSKPKPSQQAPSPAPKPSVQPTQR